jgi:hypothetical protein
MAVCVVLSTLAQNSVYTARAKEFSDKSVPSPSSSGQRFFYTWIGTCAGTIQGSKATILTVDSLVLVYKLSFVSVGQHVLQSLIAPIISHDAEHFNMLENL